MYHQRERERDGGGGGHGLEQAEKEDFSRSGAGGNAAGSLTTTEAASEPEQFLCPVANFRRLDRERVPRLPIDVYFTTGMNGLILKFDLLENQFVNLIIIRHTKEAI